MQQRDQEAGLIANPKANRLILSLFLVHSLDNKVDKVWGFQEVEELCCTLTFANLAKQQQIQPSRSMACHAFMCIETIWQGNIQDEDSLCT